MVMFVDGETCFITHVCNAKQPGGSLKQSGLIEGIESGNKTDQIYVLKDRS